MDWPNFSRFLSLFALTTCNVLSSTRVYFLFACAVFSASQSNTKLKQIEHMSVLNFCLYACETVNYESR
eukprot:m.32307 g.32307  ORF g.32307 m.32307 type:complete len:69 (+) comp10776_c0_seq1:557-763(+)